VTHGVFDWKRMVKDLAKHLMSAPNKEQVSYIIADAERDVTRLGCPADFWSRLLTEYEALLADHPLPPSSRLLATKLAPTVRASIAEKTDLPGRREG
jgi:hypothetical protein